MYLIIAPVFDDIFNKGIIELSKRTIITKLLKRKSIKNYMKLKCTFTDNELMLTIYYANYLNQLLKNYKS